MYGSLGPWPRSKFARPKYGHELDANVLSIAADSLKMIHEVTETNSRHINKVRTLIKQAMRIYFLGFAFHDENLDILGFERGWDKTGQIIDGTVWELGPKRRQELLGHVKELFPFFLTCWPMSCRYR